MNEIKISEIALYPIKPTGKGLVAFASCTFNNQLSLNSIAVYSRLDGKGYRLVYPTKILPNSKEIHTFYPINKSIGDAIEKAVVNKLFEIIRKCEESSGREVSEDYFQQ